MSASGHESLSNKRPQLGRKQPLQEARCLLAAYWIDGPISRQSANGPVAAGLEGPLVPAIPVAAAKSPKSKTFRINDEFGTKLFVGSQWHVPKPRAPTFKASPAFAYMADNGCPRNDRHLLPRWCLSAGVFGASAIQRARLL